MLTILGANTASAGDLITNSARFDNNANYLYADRFGTPTNADKYTISFWIKRCSQGANDQLIKYNYGSGNRGFVITLRTDDSLRWEEFTDGVTNQLNINTNRLFRDPSAWYHIVVAYDSTQGTASNRAKLYINGVQETSLATATYPDQNFDGFLGTTPNNNKGFIIGSYWNNSGGIDSSSYTDGYMADFYLTDGYTYAASDFGETNDNGVWVPKEADVSFGTNGFHLEFKETGTSANASGIGADTSGNDNHFSVSGFSAIDITTDTPQNNFATLIPALNMALSEGNTKAVTTRTSNWDGVHSSIGVTSGKWYFEVKASRTEDTFRVIGGVAGNPENFTILFNGKGGSGDPLSTFSNTYPFYGKGVWLSHWYYEDYNDSSTASVQSNNDILQFALDMDNYKLWIGINGQFKDNSNNNVSYSDVAAGNSATVTIASGAYTGKTFFPAVALRDDEGADDNIAQINFGNPSFSISSGNSDGNGYGNFEYAVPSGFYSLCTKNLAEYG